MKATTSDAIRQQFLDYFAQRGHRLVQSHSLIPSDDKTLLFVNAGMVQFKDVFVGRKAVDYRRATSSQKCLRVSGKHNDLENVGRTARHHTFFEMLGNFSFGDYFKREAILYAWEFLTSPEYMGLPVEKLWVTVYPNDDEAAAIWRDEVGVPEARIVRDETNFWAMGDTGPCGPCSEIHIDQGKELSGGVEVPFGQGGDRYLELWNLVFMQYDRDAAGTLHPLPKPSIDTGMGLERVAAVVQGQRSNYGSDLFLPLIDRVEALTGRRYQGRFGDPDKREAEIEEDVAFRVIADHARATAFLVADGIYPENEGRGYVLRRVMRRAIRFGRKLGLEREFLHAVCDEVVQRMGAIYPGLTAARAVIERVVRQEEDRFGRTLADGLRLLEAEMDGLRRLGDSVVPGRTVFTLYDTHGFPVDLTALIAEEQGMGIDEAGFHAAMMEQRERGRASWKGGPAADTSVYQGMLDEGIRTEFVGYEWDQGTTEVVGVVRGGERVEGAGAGDEVEVFTAVTPFYAESGGQIGDHGTMVTDDGALLRVVDTTRRLGELVSHLAQVERGEVRVGDRIELVVDRAKREPTRKNHSATHLLHWALRQVLGEHVKQRGSLVASDRLRFDFSHFGPLTPAEITDVERLVNERVVANVKVQTEVLPYDQAVSRGAIAFFGEKYGERVRVVAMGESVELCGGTHVHATGDIGLFKIVAETGIASGVRRVEAVTGMEAVRWVHDRERLVRSVAERLKTSPALLEQRIDRIVREIEELERENATLKSKLGSAMAQETLDGAREIGGVRVLAVPLEGFEAKELRSMSDQLLGRLGSGVLLLASSAEGKLALLVSVTPDLTERFDAGRLVGELAPLVGGRGGGKKQLAQAGGTNPAGLQAAIDRFYELVQAAA